MRRRLYVDNPGALGAALRRRHTLHAFTQGAAAGRAAATPPEFQDGDSVITPEGIRYERHGGMWIDLGADPEEPDDQAQQTDESLRGWWTGLQAAAHGFPRHTRAVPLERATVGSIDAAAYLDPANGRQITGYFLRALVHNTIDAPTVAIVRNPATGTVTFQSSAIFGQAWYPVATP